MNCHIRFFVTMFVLICCSFVQNSFAATVQGNAIKVGETDHSNIMVTLDTDISTPALGGVGIILLFGSISLLLFHRIRSAMKICVIALGATGLSCAAYAMIRYTGFTDMSGDWVITNLIPGNYILVASCPGYNTVTLLDIDIVEGVTTVPDIECHSANAGTLYHIDDIVGNMRYVPGGRFLQSSPVTEPCRSEGSSQFIHTLTRNIAVMETEITRGMWADLKAVQPTLPHDQSLIYYSPSMFHPVQQNTWFESVLFANLLSLQNGYTRCYYIDDGFTIAIDATNYAWGPFYCDFDADGYRLASEGEWEYFTRAGTTGPFSCNETNYTSANCDSCTLGTHSILEQYCVYCPNEPGSCAMSGSKLPNPWNLKDVHGNVSERCWDIWASAYPGSDQTDYTGSISGTDRATRGGNRQCYAQDCRSAVRSCIPPDYRHTLMGFRLVRTISIE